MSIADFKKVSIVIPSVGRQRLMQSVSSVFQQDYQGDIEVVVVFDLPESEALEKEKMLSSFYESERHSIVCYFTGGGRKAGFARNLGVQKSSGYWVAFLDDDDEFSNSKITKQVEVAEERKSTNIEPVVSCRVTLVEDEKKATLIPKDTYKGSRPVEDYLFFNRLPSIGRASIFTSTLLVSRENALNIPWDASLARHQDWDWLIRLQRDGANVEIIQLPEPLVAIHVGSEGSISASSDWRSSLAWVGQDSNKSWSKKTKSDFLTAQTLRYALNAKSLRGFGKVLIAILKTGRLPRIKPLIIGISGIVPRRLLEATMKKKSQGKK